MTINHPGSMVQIEKKLFGASLKKSAKFAEKILIRATPLSNIDQRLSAKKKIVHENPNHPQMINSGQPLKPARSYSYSN